LFPFGDLSVQVETVALSAGFAVAVLLSISVASNQSNGEVDMPPGFAFASCIFEIGPTKVKIVENKAPMQNLLIFPRLFLIKTTPHFSLILLTKTFIRNDLIDNKSYLAKHLRLARMAISQMGDNSDYGAVNLIRHSYLSTTGLISY
jgi:hypothetical protein